jgi:hypothetical protein
MGCAASSEANAQGGSSVAVKDQTPVSGFAPVKTTAIMKNAPADDEAARILDSATQPNDPPSPTAPGALSPASRHLIARAPDARQDMPMQAGSGSGFFSRAMSAPVLVAKKLGAGEVDRLDAEDMRLQAIRNLRQQNASKFKPAPELTAQRPEVKLSRASSVPVVRKSGTQWGIVNMDETEVREGAKMSLKEIMEKLKSDMPDLATAALDVFEGVAKDLGLKDEHDMARTQSSATSGVTQPATRTQSTAFFTRAMSVTGAPVNEEDEIAEEEEFSLEQMSKDMANGDGTQDLDRSIMPIPQGDGE